METHCERDYGAFYIHLHPFYFRIDHIPFQLSMRLEDTTLAFYMDDSVIGSYQIRSKFYVPRIFFLAFYLASRAVEAGRDLSVRRAEFKPFGYRPF